MFRYLILFLISIQLFAGPVNKPGSFPMAVMNSQGDFIIGGNWTALIRWQGKFTRLKLPLDSRANVFYSGGITESSSKSLGILCGGSKAFLFKRSSQSWEALYSLKQSRKVGGRLRCAMNENGDWAVYDLEEGWMRVNGTELQMSSSDRAWLTSNGNDFIFMGDDGDIQKIGPSARLKENFASKLGYYDDQFRIAAKDQEMIFSDSYNTMLFQLNGGHSSQRLGISPIESGQSSGLAMAKDGSWIVAGYWGVWLGKGRSSQRIQSYILGGDKGAMAFAHSSQNGQFVAIGDDDGDFGRLQDLPSSSAAGKGSPGLLPQIPSSNIWLNSSVDWWWQNSGLIELEGQLGDAIKPHALLAVIDSGMNVGVQKNYSGAYKNVKEKANDKDDDGNGFVDDILGFDFVQDSPIPQDKHGHGTHVYGLAAKTFSKPWHQVVSVRALDSGGKSNSIDLARAIRYAVTIDADVISCSWGGGRPTLALRDAFAEAVNKDILVFTSAGNGSINTDSSPQVPGLFPGVYSVGATDQRDQRANFSNFGQSSVFLTAPGVDIVSDALNGGKRALSGTSMAAPIAANIATRLIAYLKKNHPRLTASQRNRLVLDSLCLNEKSSSDSKCGGVDGGVSFTDLIGRL